MATINGTAGNDTLTGTSGNDTINGLGGNDLVVAGAGGGSDFIDGGAGIDSIEFRERATSAITVDFAAGTITGGGTGAISFINVERVVAGNFNDSMSGAAGSQTLTGQAGNDTLWGAGGVDTLWGGGGADTFIFREMGMANADQISDWASGSDKLVLDGAVMSALGASGNFATGDARFWSSASGAAHDADDRIIFNTTTGQVFYDADGSGSGAAQLIATLSSATLVATDIVVEGGSGGGGGAGQTINGTAGNDTLVGGGGDDTISGFGGSDSLVGFEGADVLSGGDGNDTLDGSLHVHDDFEPVADTMSGGLGNDLFIVNNPGDVLSDSGGVDTVDVLNANWTLAAGFENLILRNDVAEFGFTGIGNELANHIAATWSGSRLEGRGGNDTLIGGNDGGNTRAHVVGGEGNDSIRGTPDFGDTLDGGVGNDTIGGSGDIFVYSVAPGTANADTIVNFAGDTFRLDGAVHANARPSGRFTAGDARFWSSGTGTAHDADDRVIYNSASGQLWYDADGNGAGGPQLIATLQGAPALAATSIEIINGSNGTAGNDTLIGTAGNDLFLAGGNTGDDVIDGGAGIDSIEFRERATSAVVVDFGSGRITGGGSGTISFSNIERVVAGNFNDSLSGAAGSQTLTGQSGNDTLWGAAGVDTLWGGGGADRFVFRETGTANADRISDWASASDKVALDDAAMSALGATGNFAAGDGRFWAAAGATAGHDANDRVVYNTSTGSLYYDADGSGAGSAQLIATFSGNPAVAATDITVI